MNRRHRPARYPVLRDGTVYWAAAHDGTVITKNGSQVASGDVGDSGSFAVTYEDILRAPIDTALVFSIGAVLFPEFIASKKAAFSTSRYQPHDVQVWARQGGTVECRKNDPDAVSADYSLTLGAGEFGTFQEAASTVDFFMSSTDTDFLCFRKSYNDSGDNLAVPPAASEAISYYNENEISFGSAPLNNSIYKYSTDGSLFAMTGIADGSGGDAEMHLPLYMARDTYIVPHGLSDYIIGAVEDCTVTVYEWSAGWVQYGSAHVLTATKASPDYVSVGNVNGADAAFLSAPVKFSGTAPFYMRLNVPDGNDEYTHFGFWTNEVIRRGAAR